MQAQITADVNAAFQNAFGMNGCNLNPQPQRSSMKKRFWKPTAHYLYYV